MNHFLGRPLEIEEPMSPKEKAIKIEFFDKANTLRVHSSAQTHVNPAVSYANVVDAMHKEFTIGLGSRAPIDVETLNQSTINKIYDAYQKHLQAMAHTREVGFENSKIPANILPRASFKLQEDDEVTGKNQIVLR